jgi:hypothetical protein
MTVVRFTKRSITIGNPNDDRHARINYDLCRAIDSLKLGIVLEQMEEAGMHPNFTEIYRKQAESLLDLLRSENNRIHGF